MIPAHAGSWLLHTVVGGGLLLLATRLVQQRIRIPVRSQRLGEWGLAAALLIALLSLAPAWIPLPAVPVPLESSRSIPDPGLAPAGRSELENSSPAGPEIAFSQVPSEPLEPVPGTGEPDPAGREESPGTQVTEPLSREKGPAGSAPGWISWVVPGLLAGYGLVAGALLLRCLLGRLTLAWLVARGRPVPEHLSQLALRMQEGKRIRPLLVVSARVRVPFSFGLWRPTIVLPECLVSAGDERALIWVLEHEWTHLERRDARSAVLFQLGQLVYFYLPWFWSVWRQVRLTQEYLADAAAARVGGAATSELSSGVADYASFLVRWTRMAAPPAGTTGVSGSTSDLFRRIDMLVNPSTPLETRCPRRWSLGLGCGLLASAVVLAGVGWTARAEEPKKEPDKVEKKTGEKKQAEKRPAPVPPDLVVPDLNKVFPRLEPGVLPEQRRKEIEQRMEEVRQEMERVRQEMERRVRSLEQGRQPFGPLVPGMQFPNGVFRPGVGTNRAEEPRLGARLTRPSASLVEQLDLPRDQGYVLDEVGPNSPAAKAGLKQYDILLELNGQPISNKDGELAKVLKDIKADKPVEAVVLRKGRKETVKGLTLPEVKVEQPANPFGGFPGGFQGAFPAFPGGAGGAGVSGIISTSRVNDEFTTRNQVGDLDITIKGKIDQGKAVVSEVRIKSGGQEKTYDSVDKVPAEYKEKVQKLVEMSARGSVRLELRVP
jgi:beta-lactamase regulating signal transducer with metallopeptidase domain